MKHSKTFLLTLVFATFGQLSINAQNWMTPEDSDDYLQSLGYTIKYTWDIQGGYDSEYGAYIASTGPVRMIDFIQFVPDQYDGDYPDYSSGGSPYYGLFIFEYDETGNYCRPYMDEGLVLHAKGNSITDYEDSRGIFYFEGGDGNPENTDPLNIYPEGWYFTFPFIYLPLTPLRIVIYSIE